MCPSTGLVCLYGAGAASSGAAAQNDTGALPYVTPLRYAALMGAVRKCLVLSILKPNGDRTKLINGHRLTEQTWTGFSGVR